ncbi:hypothetical protein [Photobacterium phosphoreum]|uniref:hypothetical protein n=1 Tax=Photobacterium phosphoreum TaxID=659 RepID=UPI0039B0E218
MVGISKSGAERYGRMFAQLTDDSWLFGAMVTLVFLVMTICLSYSIIFYLPFYQPTAESVIAVMTTLRPLMFVFPVITAGLTFIAGFRAVTSFLNRKKA